MLHLTVQIPSSTSKIPYTPGHTTLTLDDDILGPVLSSVHLLFLIERKPKP